MSAAFYKLQVNVCLFFLIFPVCWIDRQDLFCLKEIMTVLWFEVWILICNFFIKCLLCINYNQDNLLILYPIILRSSHRKNFRSCGFIKKVCINIGMIWLNIKSNIFILWFNWCFKSKIKTFGRNEGSIMSWTFMSSHIMF